MQEELKKRLNLAEDANTDSRTLEKLANDENYWVRYLAINNANTPLEVSLAGSIMLGELSEQKFYDVVDVVDDDDTPASLLRYIYENYIIYLNGWDAWILKEHIALNENTPRDILSKLSKVTDIVVKGAVASNKNTPIDVLSKLSEDEDEDIRDSVARNENTPSDVLSKLSKDTEKRVRESVARNENTPYDIMKELCKDED